MSTQARGLQNFISDLRNAKSKVSSTKLNGNTLSWKEDIMVSCSVGQCAIHRIKSFRDVKRVFEQSHVYRDHDNNIIMIVPLTRHTLSPATAFSINKQ